MRVGDGGGSSEMVNVGVSTSVTVDVIVSVDVSCCVGFDELGVGVADGRGDNDFV